MVNTLTKIKSVEVHHTGILYISFDLKMKW